MVVVYVDPAVVVVIVGYVTVVVVTPLADVVVVIVVPVGTGTDIAIGFNTGDAIPMCVRSMRAGERERER
jgi:hypothetical protein